MCGCLRIPRWRSSAGTLDDTVTVAANEWKESDVRKVKVALRAGMASSPRTWHASPRSFEGLIIEVSQPPARPLEL